MVTGIRQRIRTNACWLIILEESFIARRSAQSDCEIGLTSDYSIVQTLREKDGIFDRDAKADFLNDTLPDCGNPEGIEQAWKKAVGEMNSVETCAEPDCGNIEEQVESNSQGGQAKEAHLGVWWSTSRYEQTT